MQVRNIYADGERAPEATVKKFLTVRREGHRDVRRDLDFYNLDMVISVGYEKFHARRIAESTKTLSDFDKTVKRLDSGRKGCRK